MKRLMLVVALMIGTLPSFADSITFSTAALQDNGGVSVPLGPGLDPLLAPGSLGLNLTFITFGAPIGPVIFSSELTLPNQQLTFGPFSFVCQDPDRCGIVFGWAMPIS